MICERSDLQLWGATEADTSGMIPKEKLTATGLTLPIQKRRSLFIVWAQLSCCSYAHTMNTKTSLVRDQVCGFILKVGMLLPYP